MRDGQLRNGVGILPRPAALGMAKCPGRPLDVQAREAPAGRSASHAPGPAQRAHRPARPSVPTTRRYFPMRLLTKDLQVARLAASVLAVALALPAAAQEFTPPRPSPGARVEQTVGTTKLSIEYSRPGVKGRAIWGALVPWGQPC